MRVLEARNVSKIFGGGLLNRKQTVALESASVAIAADKPSIVAIAGESGSGKTTLARLLLGMTPPTSGQILYQGQDLWRLDSQQRRTFRREVQAVFQDPFEVYNPFYKVDAVFNMVIQKFKLAPTRQAARKLAEEALEVVGLRPNEILGKYPHELSGGQRQRIMVARAFLLKPRLIVADEPVSMIDASLQMRILDIFRNLKEEYGISFLYITHDLSTAYQISDDIYILYGGSVMEYGAIDGVIQQPRHPYTQLLVNSITVPDPSIRWEGRTVSSASEEVTVVANQGCKFYQRCPHAMERCLTSPPPVYPVGEKQFAACYLYDGRLG